MAGPVIVAGAEPADEGSVLLVQEATACVTDRTAEPRALTLPPSDAEGPLLLEPDDCA
jgi:hypothetical protein